MQGGLTVMPGQTNPGLLNYWTNITVTPEPTTLALFLSLGGAILCRRNAKT
jgi:hypothetical protein